MITRADVSTAQRQMILATLQLVLESPHFCKSKRYPSFLEYVVHNALEEDPHALKERTVGVEVFGRAANYDTSTDPVVRVAAGEVRRRVSAYVSEHPGAPVRIDIPPGSYHAEFCFQPQPAATAPEEQRPKAEPIGGISATSKIDSPEGSQGLVNPVLTTQIPTPVETPWITKPRLAYAALLVLVAAAVGFWHHQQARAQQDFWWPVIGQNQPALILVGEASASSATSAVTAPSLNAGISTGSQSNLALADAIVTAQFCSTFREYKLQCKVSPAALATLGDTFGKSVVLVGGFNNPWTRRLLAPLPYQLQFNDANAPMTQRIREVVERKPTGDVVLGSVPSWENPAAELTKDYAIVGRFHSDITDGMAVVVAGLGRPGTSSAGQYVASPEKLQEVLSRAPKDWNGTNFEAVLEIDVVQGSSGHAKVIAARFW